ncbi:MAG: SLC13 family permease [Maricaulaceae bacterium]
MSPPADDRAHVGGRTRLIGLGLGLLVAFGLQAVPPSEALSRDALIVAGLGLLMAIWWATEAIPIPATALLPIAVLPFLGVLSVGEASRPYASPTVMLLLGGFIIALTLERWGLHKRIALNIVARAGDRPRFIVLGFMAAAALLSAWISNTATTLMMLPIALSVIDAEREGMGASGFGVALLLGTAYAASVGGVATPVGTPTNLIALNALGEAGYEIAFLDWMLLGLPIVWVFVPLSWWVLTRVLAPTPAQAAGGAAAHVRSELAALGGVSAPEARTALAFAVIALAWMGREVWIQIPGLSGLSNTGIAVAGAVAMFLIPAGDRDRPAERLMNWETAERLPWGVIILFGGGISLATAMQSTGLAAWLGAQAGGLSGLPPILFMLALVAGIIFLTELTSNVATITAFSPVVLAIALGAGADPTAILAPAAMAASFAFMLPVATAPNAVVYASGRVSIAQMIRAGFWLNLLGLGVIVGLTSGLSGVVF